MNPYSTSFSTEDIPDLSGKVIIITGGATGIGKETALQLFRHNAKVYIASRSRSKYDDLMNEVFRSAINQDRDVEWQEQFQFLELDLSSIESCILAAQEFKLKERRLDVVIANAALSVAPCTLSRDGIEVQFATNHLGHFVFIHHLSDIIQSTSVLCNEARVIVVASHAHAMYKSSHPDPICFEDLKKEGGKRLESFQDVQEALQRYARSKLANVLFARTLSTRFRRQGYANVFVNSLNPGTIGTSSSTDSAAIPSWLSVITYPLVRVTSIPPKSGALTTLLLATSPEIPSRKLHGRYFDVGPLAGKFWYGYSWDATERKLSRQAKNEQLASQLWEWSFQSMMEAQRKMARSRDVG